jgi:hypothetical protein
VSFVVTLNSISRLKMQREENGAHMSAVRLPYDRFLIIRT